LPANMGPTMTWISPDWAARTSIGAPPPARRDWAAAETVLAAPSKFLVARPRRKGRERSGGRGGKAPARRTVGAEAVAAAARRDLMAQMDRILAGFVVRTGCRRGANTFLNFFEEKLVR
jgi:hypothetical protein